MEHNTLHPYLQYYLILQCLSRKNPF